MTSSVPSFFHPTYIQPQRENGLSGQAGLGMHDWSLSASYPDEYHLQTTRGSKLSKGEERQPETGRRGLQPLQCRRLYREGNRQERVDRWLSDRSSNSPRGNVAPLEAGSGRRF